MGLKQCAIILAAGKGTRMKSARAKVLHEVFFSPMLHHVIDSVNGCEIQKVIVVTGYKRESVESSLSGYKVDTVVQKEQLGTGHAVLSCREELDDFSGTALILCGDTPLIRPQTLKAMLEFHGKTQTVLSVMTTVLDNPQNYGRIVSDKSGNLVGIVEEKDADEKTKKIKEINAGIYCVDLDFLWSALEMVGTDNKQGEMYLTDIVSIATSQGKRVTRYICEDPDEVLGVNSRMELAKAHQTLINRRNEWLMASGVTLLRPESICIEKNVIIGKDTIIGQSVLLQGETTIGSDCIVEQSVMLNNCKVGEGVIIGAFSNLEGVEIKSFEKVSPLTSRKQDN
ncbi:MAG: NTP transferase domain-containing protein [Proteobacteria bacterium]|nr:NTP transferase domain-containing protein [Pseudomonadota bacterium]MBU1708392.1 NTP transferase domain-containing protein [Pseudomonadota bacterium]